MPRGHRQRGGRDVYIGQREEILKQRAEQKQAPNYHRFQYNPGQVADQPRSQRSRTWNIFFGREEDNQFGTDGFLRFCELVGATAPIKVNPLCDQVLGPNQLDVAMEEWALGQKALLAPKPLASGLIFPMEYQDFKCYEYHGSLIGALSAAGFLHTYLRNADRMKFGTFIYGTNKWGCLVRTDGPRLLLTANCDVFDLLKGHKGADLIGMELDSADDLNVVASASQDGRRTTVSLINNQKGQSVEARLRLKGGEGRLPSRATAMVLTGKPDDENSFEEPNKVKPRAGKVEGKGSEWSVICEPFSLTVVTFKNAA